MTTVSEAAGRVARVSWQATTAASVVRVIGDLGPDTITDLRTVLAEAAGAHSWVIVDLSRTSAVHRVALNMLLAGRSAARRRGGDLLLVASPDLVRRVLHTRRMDSAFTTYPTVPRAMSRALAATGR
ncbi:STAS domain-containing protein [Actinoplanes sp. TRM 88003]|uniref:STAS domain-containing protein n=1 Tax=Paractinoplanes aksuensis TaxID=2939490 RepID=A0ABT1DZK0_9ACTN|nr:STAS domain-containing protein [Actinoplanes aksuensis]MCO8276263.1 STAS domain-containing protein [Actinoplanes aksuensis]